MTASVFALLDAEDDLWAAREPRLSALAAGAPPNPKPKPETRRQRSVICADALHMASHGPIPVERQSRLLCQTLLGFTSAISTQVARRGEGGGGRPCGLDSLAADADVSHTAPRARVCSARPAGPGSARMACAFGEGARCLWAGLGPDVPARTGAGAVSTYTHTHARTHLLLCQNPEVRGEPQPFLEPPSSNAPRQAADTLAPACPRGTMLANPMLISDGLRCGGQLVGGRFWRRKRAQAGRPSEQPPSWPPW